MEIKCRAGETWLQITIIIEAATETTGKRRNAQKESELTKNMHEGRMPKNGDMEEKTRSAVISSIILVYFCYKGCQVKLQTKVPESKNHRTEKMVTHDFHLFFLNRISSRWGRHPYVILYQASNQYSNQERTLHIYIKK